MRAALYCLVEPREQGFETQSSVCFFIIQSTSEVQVEPYLLRALDNSELSASDLSVNLHKGLQYLPAVGRQSCSHALRSLPTIESGSPHLRQDCSYTRCMKHSSHRQPCTLVCS